MKRTARPTVNHPQCVHVGIRRFSKMGIPKNGWFMRENPHLEMDDLGVPLFQETTIYLIDPYYTSTLSSMSSDSKVSYRTSPACPRLPPRILERWACRRSRSRSLSLCLCCGQQYMCQVSLAGFLYQTQQKSEQRIAKAYICHRLAFLSSFKMPLASRKLVKFHESGRIKPLLQAG